VQVRDEKENRSVQQQKIHKNRRIVRDQHVSPAQQVVQFQAELSVCKQVDPLEAREIVDTPTFILVVFDDQMGLLAFEQTIESLGKERILEQGSQVGSIVPQTRMRFS